jgi:hypothetical protein
MFLLYFFLSLQSEYGLSEEQVAGKLITIISNCKLTDKNIQNKKCLQ